MLGMLPCPGCQRHLRETERICPFCAEIQRSVASPVLGMLALASVFALTSCASERDVVGDDELGSSSSTESTTESTSESSTESEVTDSDDSVDSQNNTSLSFYAGPDPDYQPTSFCDPFQQDCPDGEKCVPYASSGGVWDANKCVPITGDGQAGDPCVWGGIVEATDDCGGDSICWDVMDVDDQLIGTCAALCTGSADEPICDPDSSCLISNDGSITLCLADCDPLLQDCGAGLGCFWAQTNFSCIFTTDDIPTGDPCGYFNDCLPGNYCADAAALPECNGSACCAGYCDLADPVCLFAGTECVAFFEVDAAPPGLEDVGVCLAPP
jgi:hypothetical protein